MLSRTERRWPASMLAARVSRCSRSCFLIPMTRIAVKATLVVSSGGDLERAVQRNPGEKTVALEVNALTALPERSLGLEL
jgi:hypothetical protein